MADFSEVEHFRIPKSEDGKSSFGYEEGLEVSHGKENLLRIKSLFEKARIEFPELSTVSMNVVITFNAAKFCGADGIYARRGREKIYVNPKLCAFTNDAMLGAFYSEFVDIQLRQEYSGVFWFHLFIPTSQSVSNKILERKGLLEAVSKSDAESKTHGTVELVSAILKESSASKTSLLLNGLTAFTLILSLVVFIYSFWRSTPLRIDNPIFEILSIVLFTNSILLLFINFFKRRETGKIYIYWALIIISMLLIRFSISTAL